MSFKSLPVLVALACGLVAGSAAAVAQTAPKIGVFDAQRITQDTAEGAKIQARLNSLKERKGAELKKIQEELEKLQQQYVQAAPSASEEKRKELGLQIQRKQDEFEGAQKSAQRELQMEVEQAQEGWQRRVLGVVGQYGKQNGFTLIVPADIALYFNPQIDITADLVKVIDTTPAPAPAPAAPAAAPAAPKPAPKK